MTEAELVRRTQELANAIAAGDTRPWATYYADDAIFADEKGRVLDKPALIADLTPLPKGIVGAIKVEHAQARIVGAAAVLSYDLDESVSYFGQHLDNARYHTIDTWLYRDGAWRIVASQTMRRYEDPAAAPLGQIDPERLGELGGVYELVPETTRVVSLDKGHLYVARGERPREELLPEAQDLFFRKGVEGRILFRRDPAGRVDALVDRRNNQDVVWRRR
jgi:hypothetical protein